MDDLISDFTHWLHKSYAVSIATKSIPNRSPYSRQRRRYSLPDSFRTSLYEAERFRRLAHVSQGVRQTGRECNESHVSQEPLLANVRHQNIAVFLLDVEVMVGVISLVHRGFDFRQLRFALSIQILLACIQVPTMSR